MLPQWDTQDWCRRGLHIHLLRRNGSDDAQDRLQRRHLMQHRLPVRGPTVTTKSKALSVTPWLKVAVLIAAFALTTGCGSRGGPDRHGSNPPTAPVEFTESALVIDRLGEPVALPVVVGSKPSRENIQSTDEGVVTVNEDGTVQGIRNGTAELRTRGGRSRVLTILIRSVSAIRIVPSNAALRPGEELRLRVMSEGGSDEVPVSAVLWSTDAPAIGFVHSGVLQAWKPGKLRLRAQYGGAEAFAEAVIQGPALVKIDPPRARLSVGEVRFFRVEPRVEGAGEWSSTRSTVLASRGDGLFQAVGIGRAKACNASTSQQVCSDVEVVR